MAKFSITLKLALIIIQLMKKKKRETDKKKDSGKKNKMLASLNGEKSTVIKLLSSQN